MRVEVATVVFNCLLAYGALEINAVFSTSLCSKRVPHAFLQWDGVKIGLAIQRDKADLFSRTPTRDIARLGRFANYIVVNPFCGGTLWN